MRRAHLVMLFLVVATGAVYWQVGGHAFIEFDDDRYVFHNPRVLAGLSWEGLRWALTSLEVSNWHPLTWLSHMLDGELYGSNPRGHHLTSLAFHIVNAVLLFWLLNRMTAAFWRSAFVAALFALHPLHVESVAWISERKDLLSTFFWWLTLWLYVAWVKGPAAGRSLRYAAALLAFALGLMAKSMIVTLPFTLLLLDYWPLRRLESRLGSVRTRVVEKAPFFLLSLAVSIVTLLAQRGGEAIISTDRFPIDVRVGNALVAYLTYIGKTLWPHSLAPYYPHPVTLSLAPALGAAVVLLGLSFGVLRLARKHPYLLFGWLWYLGTLVPVIGLVQVGTQAFADRYTYVPLVGLFIMLAWGVPELLARWRRAPAALPWLAGGALAALAVCSWYQTALWKDTVILFRHTLAVTQRNAMAHAILGTALERRGDVDEAISHLHEALRLKPDLAQTHNNLGIAFHRKGRFDEAVAQYREALELKPEQASTYVNLGAALYTQGRVDEAIVAYRAALRLQPRSPEVHNNLAIALEAQGRVAEAIAHYEEALRLKPDDARAHKNLGITFYEQGRFDEAIPHFEASLRSRPDDQSLRNLLREARARRGESGS